MTKAQLISTAVDPSVENMDFPVLTVWEKLDAGLIPASRAPTQPPLVKSSAGPWDAPGAQAEYADENLQYHGRAWPPIEMEPPPVPNRHPYPYVGCIHFRGLLIYVENAAGSTRSGVSDDGTSWSTKMLYPYGELVGTRGSDNEPIDVYVGPDQNAPMAYVVHQRLGGVYDEDKVFLGFPSEREALAAYAAHMPVEVGLEPAVTELPVDLICEYFAEGRLSWGPLVKSLIEDLVKGRKAEPLGTIKFRADGHYKKVNMNPHEWRRIEPRDVKWEKDPGKPFTKLKKGDVIEVAGRDELFMIDPVRPFNPRAPSVDVVNLATEAKERVRASTVVPMRPAKPRAQRSDAAAVRAHLDAQGAHAAKVSDRTKELVARGFDPRTAREMAEKTAGRDFSGRKIMPPPPPAKRAPLTVDEGTAVVQPGEVAKRAGVVKDSQAKAGTIHYKLEHGEYLLQRVKDRTGVRFRWAINVPDEDKAALIGEFTPLLNRTARMIAKRRPTVTVSKFGQLTPEYEEVLSGAKLGMFMALRNYDGSKPFVPWVEGYMKAYAAQGKRAAAGSAQPWTQRDRRLVHTYLAAAYRASSKKGGADPSVEEIAAAWHVPKTMAYSGTAKGLGSYQGPTGKAVNQASEPLPLEDWQIKTPLGEPKGKFFPGKKKLIERMKLLTAGDRVGSILDKDIASDEITFSSTVPAGIVEHVKGEIEQAVDALPEPNRTVIRMLAGLHDDTVGDTGGVAATRDQIAEAVGIAPGQSVQSQRRKLRDSKLVETSLAMLTQIAAARGYTAERFLRQGLLNAAGPGAESDRRQGQRQGPYGASHRELAARFGSDKAVGEYYTAMRAGYGSEVASFLDRAKAGKVKPREQAVHDRRMAALDRAERQKRFYAATKVLAVEPGLARTSGPQGEGDVPLALSDEDIRAALLPSEHAPPEHDNEAEPPAPKPERKPRKISKPAPKARAGKTAKKRAAKPAPKPKAKPKPATRKPAAKKPRTRK